ncbi:Retrovirus-related Pol polyprotein from type-1 retrotransposable element R1 4 [Eumeta japonica]|uniref:Retrovirus-related Pol polyprotein from type-1 retrotransposable element R1 4 n=1 Tax=Eumeta variegata TaxID=151549 RepID=A0A4C1YZA3_EUMVA|nr:Retrovirus-related Pol polyprotein from type-1 retrotransposable element R1 4 [Eumeta japonica]
MQRHCAVSPTRLKSDAAVDSVEHLAHAELPCRRCPSARCVQHDWLYHAFFDSNPAYLPQLQAKAWLAFPSIDEAACPENITLLVGKAWVEIIYRGTFVAVITYAAAIWFRRANYHVVRSALLRAQRPTLILLTRAYRSTSTYALPVLEGVLPADLEVVRRREERWEGAPEGWELYSFFPDVRERMNKDTIEPDYVSSQMLTGHGCFRKRLYEMKLSIRKDCDCGWYEETRDHVLWHCPLCDDERKEMMDKLEYTTIGPVHFADLTSTRGNFYAFRGFCLWLA